MRPAFPAADIKFVLVASDKLMIDTSERFKVG